MLFFGPNRSPSLRDKLLLGLFLKEKYISKSSISLEKHF